MKNTWFPDKSGKFDINIIIEAVVIFLVLGIALAILGPFANVTSVSDDSETFLVTDDSIDQSLELNFIPSSGVVVEKYNASGWSSVSSSFISLNRNVVTVDKDGI